MPEQSRFSRSTASRRGCVVLAAEWVVGDQGWLIQPGDTINWEVRPPDESESSYVTAAANLYEGSDMPSMFVLHSDDPNPPAQVTGQVAGIWSIVDAPWSTTPDVNGLSLRVAKRAVVDPAVDSYLFEINGHARFTR